MIEWVLFVLLIAKDGTPTMTSEPFITQAACEEAGLQLWKAWDEERDMELLQVKWKCLSKARGQP